MPTDTSDVLQHALEWATARNAFLALPHYQLGASPEDPTWIITRTALRRLTDAEIALMKAVKTVARKETEK